MQIGSQPLTPFHLSIIELGKQNVCVSCMHKQLMIKTIMTQSYVIHQC